MTFFFLLRPQRLLFSWRFISHVASRKQNALDLGEVLEATDVESEVVQKKEKKKKSCKLTVKVMERLKVMTKGRELKLMSKLKIMK